MATQRGFTLIELLIAIAVVLAFLGGLAALFLSERERKTCIDQLTVVQNATLAASRNPGDYTLCKNAQSLVNEYNKDCGGKLGNLQVPKCE